jgi:hypothetical protein
MFRFIYFFIYKNALPNFSVQVTLYKLTKFVVSFFYFANKNFYSRIVYSLCTLQCYNRFEDELLKLKYRVLKMCL